MDYGLTCNFTLQGEGLGVAFQSNNGGMNYGGVITVQTPATAGPVVTNLWDSDGNVFFTIYSGGDPSGPNCVINSGSIPGSFTPYIEVASQNGLHCEILDNGGSDGVYNYTLQVTPGTGKDFAAKPLTKQRSASS